MAVTDDLVQSVNCSGPGSFPLISKTGVSIVRITAANFDATMTKVGSYSSAYAPLTNAILNNHSVTHGFPDANTYPTVVANRGQKWIITSQDSFGNLYTHTIPAANPTGHVAADNLTADLTNADWVAYIAAFNALAVNPSGDPISFLRAKLGGRRR